MRIYWADFRFPPINLWIMPKIMENHRPTFVHRAPGVSDLTPLSHRQQLITQLLAARGGFYDHKN